jgi:hypothetical protein
VEKGYFHGEGIAAASARLVATQARIGITADWGGGLVASADGMRFVVPVRSLYARPSPLYFGRGKRPPPGGDLAERALRSRELPLYVRRCNVVIRARSVVWFAGPDRLPDVRSSSLALYSFW